MKNYRYGMIRNRSYSLKTKLLIMVFFCLKISIFSAETTNDNLIERIDVLPTPKDIVLKRKGILLSNSEQSDALIIIGNDNVKRMEAAAKAINDRIKILGGKPLPIVSAKKFTPEMGHGKNLILLGNRESNSITKKYWIHQGRNLVASMPPEQGYIIRTLIYRTPWGGSIFVLAGTDSQGTYYAAATFKELIQKKGKRIVGVMASVTDWPDRKDRLIWGRHARSKNDMEYWALYKSTGISCGFHPLSLVEKKKPFTVSKVAEKVTLPRLEFGNTVGFRYSTLMMSDLACRRFGFTMSSKPWKEQLKEWDCCENQGHLFCFSREKELRQRFALLAKLVKKGKFGLLNIHFPDTDPSNYWPNRCANCKRKWGDDLNSWAKAMGWVANIFAEEIRKVNPNLKINYILRPYSSTSIDDVKWRWDETVKLMLKNIPFDDNSLICTREDVPDRIRLWRKKWNNMKMYFYVEIIPNSPSPLYTPLSRYLDSYMDGSPDDIIWPVSYRAYPDPVNVLMAIERLWNRRSNGPGLWPKDNRSRLLTDNKPKTPKEKNLLLRVCRVIFGYDAGPYIFDVYGHGLHPFLAANPAGVRKRCNVENIEKYFHPNLEAAQKAYAAVKKIVNDNIPVRSEGKRFFPVLYRLVLVTHALAEARVAIMDAEKYIAENRDKEAQNIIDKALANWRERMKELDQSDKIFKDWPPSFEMKYDGHITWKDLVIEDTSGGHGVNSKDRSAGGRCVAVERTLNNLLNNKEVIRSNIKAKKASIELAKKPIPTVRAAHISGPLTIDGKDKESDWQNAVWTGDFVRTEGMLYSREKTQTAILYDDKNIYIFFKCPMQSNKPPASGDGKPDKWSAEDEYVEVILAPDSKKGFYQLYINPAEVVGDIFFKMPKSAGGLHQTQSAREAEVEGFAVTHPKPTADSKWTSEVKCKVSQEKGIWNVEMVIPLASMRQGPFKNLSLRKGDKWKVNFCRSIPKTEITGDDYSSLTRDSYHAYWKFPELIFE